MDIRIKTLTLSRLQIPFRTAFKHAAAERAATEAVVAKVESRQQICGYGEGCPRTYVTGESLESCESFLAEHCADLLGIGSLTALRSWADAHTAEIDRNPAAWCAIETAFLDLFGKVADVPLESLLELAPLAGSFRYTAVLGAPDAKVFTAQLEQYRRLGMTDFKLKVSGDRTTDRENIAAIRAIPHAALRLDANNLWRELSDALAYLEPFQGQFWAIEEPLAANDYPALLSLGDTLGCKIILDESFCRLAQCDALVAEADRWVPNIRLSKMGGLLRSLAVAERCAAIGVRFIIGAQVGESSILTRLALALAHQMRSSLVAQEGAFGTYLLAHDVVDAPLMFGALGELPAPPPGPGLGLQCDIS